MKFRPNNKISTFYPPQRTLMGPGPSDMHPRVLSALSRPTIGYLDPVFVGMMDELKALLRYVFQTQNAITFPVSGPGSVGMEMCFVNMVDPGDKVIVCRNGVFGGRMIENVERCGGVPVIIDDAWGEAVDPHKVEEAFRKHPDAKVLAFVHAETSTGVMSDAKALAAIARRHGALTIMDAVTSLGGSPVLVDEWGIDACYSASQKCLSCTPGLSPITFSDRVIEKVRARGRKCQSWFMDLNLLLGYWGATTRTYHHTAPTNGLYGLHESLLMIHEEGLENSWARHLRNYKALKAGLETFGFRFLVKEEARLPQMSAVMVPAGVDDKEVRRRLLADYSLEIGAGLGELAGRIFRFGIMGWSSKMENVMLCLCALETVLSDMGVTVDFGAAESAAYRAYAANPITARPARAAAVR
ncbi:MAG TPA: alanine--glyoxylate aminotransferase family protein [Burkholderiales bacterium]|nr:alanine--glyoxylate aminotransferase family protein [Burkholderiales bacterium]